MTKQKIIIANWKMNHLFNDVDYWMESFNENYPNLPNKAKNIEIVVCPPAYIIDYIDGELTNLSLPQIEKLIAEKNIDTNHLSEEELNQLFESNRMFEIGAQDCHFEEKGAFTGDISARMLEEIGCKYVILGHCERRKHHQESDEIVAKKVAAAVKSGLIPVICVGENLEIRQINKHQEFVATQILNSIPQDIEFEDLIIAYEPVWSIGTGITAEVNEIKEMADSIAALIKKKFPSVQNSYLLYGGSVNSKNSAEILAIENIDGLLVGTASLQALEFLKIIQTVPAISQIEN